MNIIIPFFEKQLKEEIASTRKMLEVVPDDKYDWQPHAKSMSIRRLATHIAELPTWIPLGLDTDELDFSKGDYKATPIDNTNDLLRVFDENQIGAFKALSKTNDEFLLNPWTMRDGETVYFTISKQDVIRMTISQMIHHRAQLGVFLRLLNIPIPGPYGPSADEMGL